jgi:hypothetical protein
MVEENFGAIMICSPKGLLVIYVHGMEGLRGGRTFGKCLGH